MMRATDSQHEIVGRLATFDGDKSPAESADKSAHSRVVAASPRWEECGPARLSRACLAMSLLAALLAAGCGSKPATALDLAGRPVDPLQTTNAKAILLLFVSSSCPISNRYAPEFRRLHERFAPRGVTIWRVYPDADDTAAVIQEHQREFGLPGDALRDPQHALVNLAGARVTPEVAVFLPGGRRVYHGRIDDWYTDFGKSRPEPTRRDLQEALESVLAGRSVSNATTTAIGCQIGRR